MTIFRKIVGPAGLLTVLLMIFSCSEFDRNPTSNQHSNDISESVLDSNVNKFDIAEFKRNRDLWTSKNIQHYRMIIGAEGQMSNFPEEVLVEVSDQKIKSIKSLSKTGKNATQTYKGFDSVENLFGFIKEEYDRNAEKIEVIYDEELGYPHKILVDRTQGTDDEIKIKITELTRVDR